MSKTTDNDKTAIHERICKELNALYARKNHDYGDSFHKSYLEEGLAMSRIRLGDKYERFKTLSRNRSDQKVTDESIRDTLIDLANYAIMTIMELDAEEDCENKNKLGKNLCCSCSTPGDLFPILEEDLLKNPYKPVITCGECASDCCKIDSFNVTYD